MDTSNVKISLWEKLWKKMVYGHKFCTVYENKFRHPMDKREGIFLSIDICDSVQIIAETPENKILLVQQFRFGSEELSLEFPAGRLEKDEDIIGCAGRELFEETGYAGQNAKIIAVLYQSPAVQANKTYVVHIANCRQISQPHFDEMEEITTLVATKAELINSIKSGEITSSIALSAAAKFLL
ncbi:MAG: NUDIX hydrolase [Puniceicoccales bacterium]|jgi:8-oxo-dGTP pyrophosphatase MutT (NUDIX family)|nr:NUDIX hydrolase [Puniceicoccales bacterium]